MPPPPFYLILIWILLSNCYAIGENLESFGHASPLKQSCKQHKCEWNTYCNPKTRECECKAGFSLKETTANNIVMCFNPAKLGEECLSAIACLEQDSNTDCAQEGEIAKCKCKPTYHAVYDKNIFGERCVPETQLLSGDLATLIGVGVGMTLFCGLTCLVLRIFARARFGPRHRHYANAHLAPPITLSTEHDGERGRGSRHSSLRSHGSAAGSRRPSLLLAPPSSRPGSRRASSSSIRSTASARSYSLKAHNHQRHQHKRPSDPNPETAFLGANLNKTSLLKSDTNIGPPGGSGTSSPAQLHSPHSKAKRSGSAGAI